MNIREVIAILNQMRVDDVVVDYAIGGAVGATFYIEPAATLDVDVFIAFKCGAGSLIIDARPVYEYLKRRAAPGKLKAVDGVWWP